MKTKAAIVVVLALCASFLVLPAFSIGGFIGYRFIKPDSPPLSRL